MGTVSLRCMSEAWLSAIAAVVVAILGILGSVAGNWSTRRALKHELDSAKLIDEVYPDDDWLRRAMHERIRARVSLVAAGTPYLWTARALVLAYGLGALALVLEFLRPWLVSLGGLSARLGRAIPGTEATLLVVALVSLGASAASIVAVFVRMFQDFRSRRTTEPDPPESAPSDSQPASVVEVSLEDEVSPEAQIPPTPSGAETDSDHAGEPAG
jgi:hypothetical protein